MSMTIRNSRFGTRTARTATRDVDGLAAALDALAAGDADALDTGGAVSGHVSDWVTAPRGELAATDPAQCAAVAVLDKVPGAVRGRVDSYGSPVAILVALPGGVARWHAVDPARGSVTTSRHRNAIAAAIGRAATGAGSLSLAGVFAGSVGVELDADAATLAARLVVDGQLDGPAAASAASAAVS
jgi:hypothetical protein